MNKKIALIPVDARPVTYDMAKDLGNMAGWDLITPDKEILGFLKEPADLSALEKWMEKTASEVDGMIVSMDMILYGGLVLSRINTDTIQIIRQRLSIFSKLKEFNPNLKIMAFSSTMRISNNYVNIEEKDYWEQYGREIWAYSFHYHRYKKLKMKSDYEEYTRMEKEVPDDIMEDYRWTRERNFQINLSLMDYIDNGVLDLLIFPQDDTSEFGFNIMEQEQLKQRIYERELFSKVLIYPGADEVAALLTARLIYNLENKSFPTFYPIYSGINGALTVASYEDRLIYESVKGQIYALGSHTVESIEEADVVLGINVPGDKQGEIALVESLSDVDTNNRNVGEWLRKLDYYKSNGKSIGIIDVAYANGADTVMIQQLLSTFSFKDLDGFAAWNTAGNTIGTVIAQTALVHFAKKEEMDIDYDKEKLLLIRFLDDYLYQSVIRQKVREIVNEDEISSIELLNTVKNEYIDEAEMFLKKLKSSTELSDIYLPWNRTFEIGIHLR